MNLSPFHPNPARAAEIDRRARHALANSLQSVFDACHGHLTASPQAQAALLSTLRAHPVAPAVFGIYTALVEALFAEDHDTAQQLMTILLQPALAAQATARVVTLDEASLGQGVPVLYARTIDDDPSAPIRIAPVSAPALTRGRALYHAATDLLRAACPDLLGEIQHIAHETVLVTDPTLSFDGASTFYLWGSIVLNITRQQTRAALATALAHEAGHAYLLGATLGAPLVDNDPAQRFKSPLRSDPRPMDGLVHASFVIARMIWCQDHMLASGHLTDTEQTEVRTARAYNHQRFLDSAPVITAHARFTDMGASLWTAARDWVANGCPL